MKLSSQQLEAFFATANCSHFGRAAEQLHITQSALSQRIKNLEDDLGLILFVRGRQGIKLTEQGYILLRFCRGQDAMERELRNELGQAQTGLAGPLRIAGFSTINRSVILPSLVQLLADNAEVQLSLVVEELRVLPDRLMQGEVDFLVMSSAFERVGVETLLLGHEEYVLVQSNKHADIPDVYLDHDHEDAFTHNFLQKQKSPPKKLRRMFLGDIYGILDGAALGLGYAVAPVHLIAGDKRLTTVAGLKSYKVPVYLHYLTQPYYSKLHLTARAFLKKEVHRRLSFP